MLKNWYTRLARIASGSFGSAKEDGFSLETSLTKFERFVHFWVLVVRSFVRNRCPIRASALSYTTLLALIPMLAVAMGVTNAILASKGEAQIRVFIEEFVEKVVPSAALTKYPGILPPLPASAALTGLEDIQFDVDLARDKIGSSPNLLATNDSAFTLTSNPDARTSTLLVATETNQIAAATSNPTSGPTPGMSEAKLSVATQAANFIYAFAKKSSPTTLGFTGMFFLILTAILMLTRVEETFNDIWGVARGRDWWSRITNYTFTIGFGPVLLIIALGLMNSPGLQKSQEFIRHIPLLEPLLTRVLPLLIICFTFALFYKLIPNTTVDFGAALVGGSLAGVSWHCYNKIAVWIAVRAISRGDTSTVDATYAGLAILPLLMAGLYVVWLTVLFGAQVAYAFQNRASYLQDRLVENVNQRGREFVALRLMTCIGQRFHQGQPSATIREISTELGIPSKLVQQIMRTLLAAGLVVEIAGPESGYSPARPLETINCHHILLAMRATHGQEPATRDEPVRVEVLGEFARIQAAEREAAASVSMLALVNRAQARLGLAAPVLLPTDIALPKNLAASDATIAVDQVKAVSETPTVAFVEAAPASPSAGPANLDELSHHAQAEISTVKSTSPRSISSPTPAVATNENESFPL